MSGRSEKPVTFKRQQLMLTGKNVEAASMLIDDNYVELATIAGERRRPAGGQDQDGRGVGRRQAGLDRHRRDVRPRDLAELARRCARCSRAAHLAARAASTSAASRSGCGG
jgi:hypothetical protein